MDDSKAMCPQCKKDVTFQRQGQVARCPACGFQYELQEPPTLPAFAPQEERASSALFQFLKVATIAVLVALGVGALLLAVLYVGCALVFRG